MFTGNYHCATWVIVMQLGRFPVYLFFLFVFFMNKRNLIDLHAFNTELHYPLMGLKLCFNKVAFISVSCLTQF